VVQRVRRALGTRSVGHSGTLDPFATGLLIVLVGGATRLARFMAGLDKTYLATARLGVTTETDDLLGAVVAQAARPVTDAEVTDAVAGFLGPQQQRPPAYSARHVDGERSYRLARRGVAVELPESAVVVHAIELVGRDGDLVTFRTTVSTGTYIRAIARDLGARLGTGAHLTALRRERIGDFAVSDAVPLDALESTAALVPPRRLIARLPVRELDEAEGRAVRHGRALPAAPGDAGMVSLVQGERLVAVAEADEGWLRPRVVLETS
jgi:tRNA pseudouridine55 synthase